MSASSHTRSRPSSRPLTGPSPERLRSRARWVLGLLVGIGLLGVAGYFIGYPHTRGYLHWRYARAALQAGEPREAREHLLVCAEVWPGSAETQFLLARVCRRTGLIEEAREHLQRADDLGWASDEVYLERLLHQAADGDVSEVEGTLIKLLQAGHPDELLIFEGLLTAYLEIHYVQELERWGSVWIERYPEDYRAYLARGRAYDLQYRTGAAIADYRKAVSLKPDAPEAHFALGDVYRENGLVRESQPHLEYAFQRHPQNPRNAVSLARCYRLLGEPEKARDLLDGWLKANGPTDVSVLSLRGRVERDLSDPDKALPWLEQARKLSPRDAATVSMLANVHRELGRTAESQEYLRQMDDITKQYNRLDQLMRDLHVNRDSITSRHEIGLLLLRLGHSKPGVRWLMSVLEIDPQHPPANLALADFFDSIGDRQQAKNHRLAAEGKLKPVLR